MKLASIVKKKMLKEEKEYDIMDIADDLKDKYPNAYHFYMDVYSTSMFERAAKKLDDMVSGELLPMKVYEDTFGTLESLLKP